MKVEISVPEAVSFFKEIQEKPEKLFEMIRVDVRQSVGEYLSELMCGWRVMSIIAMVPILENSS
jgi:hypothetical protein